jgi:hypothetical protein
MADYEQIFDLLPRGLHLPDPGLGPDDGGGAHAGHRRLHTGPAAGPPVALLFLQRVEENKRATEKGEVKDNRSFLAK